MLVDQIWQIGATGREYSDRPGSWIAMTADATAKKLTELGFANAQIGKIGDRTSADLF
jgi:hypothetical protein